MSEGSCNVTMLHGRPMTKFEKEFDAWKTAYKSKYSECQMLAEQVNQLKNALKLALAHYTGSLVDYDFFLIECGYKTVEL